MSSRIQNRVDFGTIMFRLVDALFDRAESDSRTGRSAVSSGDLLKRATQQKRDGDLDEAVDTLREAYELTKQESVVRGVDTYLRLPMYLQKAGRPDEAWREFNRLLHDGYPNQLEDPSVRPMDNSRVYDKMRLFLQREAQEKKAVQYGILSMISWARGLLRQDRVSEYNDYIQPSNVEGRIEKLLKKAGCEEKIEVVAQVALKALDNPESVEFDRLGKRLGDALHE